MANATEQYSKEDLEAVRIMALLSGADTSTLFDGTDEDDDFDIEIVDDKPKKEKKTKRKSAKMEVIGSEKQVFTTKMVKIPELDTYKNVNRKLKFDVVLNDHVIPYKEQKWPIPERVVEYQVEMVTMPQVARCIAEKFGGNVEEEKNKAAAGEVRYLRLVSYDNIPYKAREIGYVKLSINGSVVTTRQYIPSGVLKENHIDPQRVKDSLKTVLKGLVEM